MSAVSLGIGAPDAPEVNEPAADPGGPDVVWADDVSPEVPEPVVRGILSAMGVVLAQVLEDPDVVDHWRFTSRELDDLTPPVARIINRRPQLRRAVQAGDEITVAIQLAGYVGRNVADGARARAARNEEEELIDGNREREAGVDPGPPPVVVGGVAVGTGIGPAATGSAYGAPDGPSDR